MPKPGLIKENHLDPEFLRKLLTGGNSSSFDLALTEYVKKTDKITKSQLHQDYLNEVNDAIAAVEARLANYYSKFEPISRAEIDSEFESDIAALEIAVSNFNQIASDLEATVAGSVNNYIENSNIVTDVTEAVKNNVETMVSNISQTVINHGERIAALEIQTEDLESDVDRLETDLETTNQSVQTVQNNISTINNSITSINAILDRIGNIDTQLSEFRSTCANTYRQLEDKIIEEDLDPAIVQTIGNLQTAVESLQNTNFNPMVQVEGSAGQVATIDHQGSLVGADLVYFAYAYDWYHETEDAQFKGFSPIIDLNEERVLTISHALWNEAARRNRQRETVPLNENEKVTEATIENSDQTEEDINWPKDDDESTYQDLVMTASNIAISVEAMNVAQEQDPNENTGTEDPEPTPTLTIEGKDVSVSNPYIDKRVYVDIGFYGTQFKIYGKISSVNGFEATINIDNRQQYDLAYGTEKSSADGVCLLCVEGLSEGPHRIRFIVGPEETLKLLDKIKIDAVHGVLLFKEDIFPDFFWEETLYDGGNYFRNYTAEQTDAEPITITHTYPEDLISEHLEKPNPTWYEASALDYSDIKYIGKFICNKDTDDLYYCDGTSMIKMIESPRNISLEQMQLIIDAILGDDDEDDEEESGTNP